MKTFVKLGFFVILLVGFGVVYPNVYADSGDNSSIESGSSMDSGNISEIGTTVNTYTVNFVTNGGGTVDSQSVEEGEKLNISAISVYKDGYSFSGWYTENSFENEFDIENDVVMSNLTLYAKWREHKIIVYYHPNGGVNGKNGNPVKDPLPYAGSLGVQYLYYDGINWNGSNAAPDYISNSSTWYLSKRGYVGHIWWLVGSSDSKIKLPTNVRFSKNRKVAESIGKLDEFKQGDIEMHLYADWTLENYNLTYTGIDDCIFVDGENPTTYTMLSGDIILNNPSKTGYTFMGRSGTDIDGLSTSVVITGDSVGNRMFEAIWQINSYSITYDIDGNNKNIVTGDYNSDIIVPQNPERNGYKFLGWEPEIPEKMPAEDITITAKWEKLGYSGGGSKSSSVKNDSDNGKDKSDDDKKSEKDSESKDNLDNDKNVKESERDDIVYGGKIDLNDLMDVYLWALDNGITTGKSLEEALPDGYIERGEMAKLVVDFSENVLGKKVPVNIPSQCSRGDDEKEWKSDEMKNYAQKSCALGLMGIYMKNFKPNKLLDRAEFGTIVSRLLWGDKYNKPNATRVNKYYTKHLEEVKKENLITKIDNPEQIKELRKWIWTVLKKIKK